MNFEIKTKVEISDFSVRKVEKLCNEDGTEWIYGAARCTLGSQSSIVSVGCYADGTKEDGFWTHKSEASRAIAQALGFRPEGSLTLHPFHLFLDQFVDLDSIGDAIVTGLRGKVR